MQNLFKNDFISGEGNFDVVISLGVLEHIESLEECLLIHNKLLKKDGLLVIDDVLHGPVKKALHDFLNKNTDTYQKIDYDLKTMSGYIKRK